MRKRRGTRYACARPACTDRRRWLYRAINAAYFLYTYIYTGVCLFELFRVEEDVKEGRGKKRMCARVWVRTRVNVLLGRALRRVIDVCVAGIKVHVGYTCWRAWVGARTAIEQGRIGGKRAPRLIAGFQRPNLVQTVSVTRSLPELSVWDKTRPTEDFSRETTHAVFLWFLCRLRLGLRPISFAVLFVVASVVVVVLLSVLPSASVHLTFDTIPSIKIVRRALPVRLGWSKRKRSNCRVKRFLRL